MAVNQANIRVEISDEIPKEVSDFVIENEEAVAKLMEGQARGSTAFKDVTGRLRKSIKAQKSKYRDGGWIVKASAPHAHLIEYGCRGNPPRSFLRAAKERVIQDAVRLFGAKP